VLVFVCGRSLASFVLASVVELESPAVSRIHPSLNVRKLSSRSKALR